MDKEPEWYLKKVVFTLEDQSTGKTQDMKFNLVNRDIRPQYFCVRHDRINLRKSVNSDTGEVSWADDGTELKVSIDSLVEN